MVGHSQRCQWLVRVVACRAAAVGHDVPVIPMFFKKPTPLPSAPSAEERAAIARQQQTAKLQQALEKDPAFKVMTVDGLGWLCPYTGVVIAAPFDYLDPALKHLLSTQPWTRTQKKSIEQLQAVRWLHWLRQQLPDEARLQILGTDRRWLNPFTGQWLRLQRQHQSLTDDCIKDIAVALSQCPKANQLKMLTSAALTALSETKEEAASHDLELSLSGPRAAVSPSVTTPIPAAAAQGDADRRQAANPIRQLLSPLPRIPGHGLHVHYEAQESVGGDFHECTTLGDGRWLLLIGEVTGRGIQGAMMVVAALKSLRHILTQTQEPVEVLARLSDDLTGDLLADQSITVFAAVLDAPGRTLTYVGAGHHAAIRGSTRRAQVIERLGTAGPAIGLASGEALRQALRPVTIALEPGDRVVLWTTGLTAATDAAGVGFGDWRAMGAMLATLELPGTAAVSQVVAEARRWCKGAIADDLTLIVLDVDAEPALA